MVKDGSHFDQNNGQNNKIPGVLDIFPQTAFIFWPKLMAFLEMLTQKNPPSQGHQGHGVARGSSRILQRWLGLFRAGEGQRQQLTVLKVDGWSLGNEMNNIEKLHDR